MFALTWQASRCKKSIFWFQGMKLPEVIHQLCDEIATFTICSFWSIV